MTAAATAGYNWTHRTVPPEYKKQFRTWTNNLEQTYGIDLIDFYRLLVEQGGGCALCGKAHAFFPRGHRLLVDHCHATHRIRGLLCQKCNTGLGKLGDDIPGLRRALIYLIGSEPPDIEIRLVCRHARGGIWFMRWEDSGGQHEQSTGTTDRAEADSIRDSLASRLNMTDIAGRVCGQRVEPPHLQDLPGVPVRSNCQRAYVSSPGRT